MNESWLNEALLSSKKLDNNLIVVKPKDVERHDSYDIRTFGIKKCAHCDYIYDESYTSYKSSDELMFCSNHYTIWRTDYE